MKPRTGWVRLPLRPNPRAYHGVSIDGYDKRREVHVLHVRDWLGWPDIDVPLPVRRWSNGLRREL